MYDTVRVGMSVYAWVHTFRMSARMCAQVHAWQHVHVVYCMCECLSCQHLFSQCLN